MNPHKDEKIRDFKNEARAFFGTKAGAIGAVALVSIILLLLAFQAGMHVGYRKAFFSIKSGDRFLGMFEGGEKPRMMMRLPLEDSSAGHGAVGKVVSVSLPNFVMATSDNAERTIEIATGTVVRRFRTTVAPNDIHADDYAVVLGDPKDTGEIRARFIRLMPAPEGGNVIFYKR